ncbi:hypothetical protein QBC40DRAFT_331296 [Triangularia verruculosa]|uniref:Pentatricopeptide repeat domain-containing protein n=1 Tax=Triangularia verruculosa TaxID=2587418 RepID=A0AAN6XDF4_9PEZI|nr:hypothetical protein QBC40DRAFT_331296 [Triangularia verruculosa]
MTSLLSLAARLQGCHCRACHRTANTIARQSPMTRVTPLMTNAQSHGRRKVLASDVFTACYTAIMATAAVFDAGQKDRRRRDLDEKIEETKQSLAALAEANGHSLETGQASEAPEPSRVLIAEAAQQLPSASMPEGASQPPPQLQRQAGRKRRPIPRPRPDQETPERPPQTLRYVLNRICKTRVVTPYRKSHKLERPATGFATLSALSKAMAVEEAMMKPLTPEPNSEVARMKTAAMVDSLVDRLIKVAYWKTEKEAPGTHPALNSPDSARTMVKMLRSDGYPRYEDTFLDAEGAAVQRARLNEANMKVISQFNPWRRERFVAKICFNILTCEVSPSIQNYNSLIWGFTNLGEHDLAQAVVDSFLNVSRFRPTEATLLCLLYHYRAGRDLVGFHTILRRFFGYDSRGMRIRRRVAVTHFKRDRHQGINRLAWAAEGDVARIRGYYIQRVPLSQPIMEAIIEGLLDFERTLDAVQLFQACLNESWTPNADLFKRLCELIVAHGDWVSAKALILGHLAKLNQTTFLFLGSEDGKRPAVLNSSPARQLRRVLTMTKSLWVHDRDPPWIQPGERRLRHLERALWIQEVQSNLHFEKYTTRRIRSILCSRQPLTADRIDLASSIVDNIAKRHRSEAEYLHRLETREMISAIKRQCALTKKWREQAEHGICEWLAWRFRWGALRRLEGYLNPAIPFTKRFRKAMRFGTPGTVEYEVAGIFKEAHELEQEMKLTLARALPARYIEELKPRLTESGDMHWDNLAWTFTRYLYDFQDEMAAEERRARMAFDLGFGTQLSRQVSLLLGYQ